MVFAIVLGFLVSAWVIAQLLAGKRPAAYHRLADGGKSSTLAGENVPKQRDWPKLYAVFPGGWNGGGGLVHIYNREFYRQAADWYVAEFYKSHGCKPIGEHSFEVHYSRDGSAPVRTPIGNGSGERQLTIRFVMVPEENQADYEGTDLRYAVKT